MAVTRNEDSFEDTKGLFGSSVFQRRTYSTMTKRNRTKRQTMVNKTLHRKIKIE